MTTRNPVPVVLVGCGEHAQQNLLPALRMNPTLHLMAICDPDADIGRTVARATGVPWFRSAQEGITSVGPKLVVAAAPPSIHEETAALALEAGSHVFVEKPAGLSGGRLRALARLGAERGLVTAVGHNLRHASAVRQFVRVLRSPDYGRTAAMTIRYVCSGPKGERWGLEPLKAFLFSHVTHSLDLARFFGGDLGHVGSHYVRLSNGAIWLRTDLESSRVGLITLLVGTCGDRFELDLWAASDVGHTVRCIGLAVVEHCRSADKPWRRVWRPRTLESGMELAGYGAEIDALARAVVGAEGISAGPSFEEVALNYDIMDQIAAGSLVSAP